MKNALFILLVLTGLLSCNETAKVVEPSPLENLTTEYKTVGESKITDVLNSLSNEEGANFLLDKKYMTPLMHGRIKMHL